ncbi:MAG: heparinase II/III family protein [Clostridia bacterium]|nr:heparinase II/III family protein [Clostridia bacterium]
MRRIEERRTSPGQLFPFPEDGRLVEENPPCLSWLRVPDAAEYTAVIYRDGHEIWRGSTRENWIVPDPLPGPGVYTWNLFTADAERGERTFTLAEKHAVIRRASASAFYDAIPDERPRHLFSASDLGELRERTDIIAVLRRNIDEAYRDGIPERPLFHRDPDALPYREYFGRFRDFCDRDLIACALGYAVLGDGDAGAHAKELFLTFCDWNPAGPCSLVGRWGDEVGLSMARCLPSVLDLLWPLLDPKERDYAARTVRAYGEQCFERLERLDFPENPGNSHAGRIPAYLGEAAAVLKGTGVQSREEAVRWLDCALGIYGGIFPYYGTPDGGWAEGPFYCTSYVKWFLPFFSLAERCAGVNFLERPFYQRLTQFLLHFADPAFENHPFGDGYWCAPEDAEWPGFFAQDPMRVYADRFGPALARERERDTPKPALWQLHLLDLFLPSGKPPEVSLTGDAGNIAVFPDAGFAALHTDLAHPERDFAILMRASKFGSDSHRHPDQGSFALFLCGIALVSPSGYFGREYGSAHHRLWCNSTRAHNAILVDGEGQAPFSMTSVGKIVEVRDDGETKRAVLDLTEAYPMLTLWRRTLILGNGSLNVIDEIEADHPVAVTWPLHTLSRPVPDGNAVTVERRGARMMVTPQEGDLTLEEILDRFPVDLNEGVPEAYRVTMPEQFHLYWKTPRRAVHRIEVELAVSCVKMHKINERDL